MGSGEVPCVNGSIYDPGSNTCQERTTEVPEEKEIVIEGLVQPEYEIRTTVEIPIIGWVTPLPTQAELSLATSTAAVTATTAVVVTSIVQQLIKVITPVLKLAIKKTFKRKPK